MGTLICRHLSVAFYELNEVYGVTVNVYLRHILDILDQANFRVRNPGQYEISRKNTHKLPLQRTLGPLNCLIGQKDLNQGISKAWLLPIPTVTVVFLTVALDYGKLQSPNITMETVLVCKNKGRLHSQRRIELIWCLENKRFVTEAIRCCKNSWNRALIVKWWLYWFTPMWRGDSHCHASTRRNLTHPHLVEMKAVVECMSRRYHITDVFRYLFCGPVSRK